MQPDASSMPSTLAPEPADDTLRIRTPELMVSPGEYQALLQEVQAARQERRDRMARIQHLEQALDQALTSIEEMRLKLEEQSFLEAQLVATEKFACVQQQAIARLRLRVQQQQRLIETHLTESRETRHRPLDSPMRRRLATGLSSELPALDPPSALSPAVSLQTSSPLADPDQTAEVAPLPRALEEEVAQLRQLSTRLQDRLLLSQERVQELSLAFDQHETVIAELQDQLQQVQTFQSTVRKGRVAPHSRSLVRQNRAIATLGQELARAQIKVEELEIELARQVRQLALWQQRYREGEEEGNRHRERILHLEQQTTDLQEQVFQQARQIGEYEAAIQHWKDQYDTSQSQIARLQELLEEVQLQFLTHERDTPALSALFSELLAVVEFATMPSDRESQRLSSPPIPRLNSLELPDFLLRRRNYRTP